MLTTAAILATLSARERPAIALSLTALVVYAVLAAWRGRSARRSSA